MSRRNNRLFFLRVSTKEERGLQTGTGTDHRKASDERNVSTFSSVKNPEDGTTTDDTSPSKSSKVIEQQQRRNILAQASSSMLPSTTEPRPVEVTMMGTNSTSTASDASSQVRNPTNATTPSRNRQRRKMAQSMVFVPPPPVSTTSTTASSPSTTSNSSRRLSRHILRICGMTRERMRLHGSGGSGTPPKCRHVFLFQCSAVLFAIGFIFVHFVQDTDPTGHYLDRFANTAFSSTSSPSYTSSLRVSASSGSTSAEVDAHESTISDWFGNEAWVQEIIANWTSFDALSWTHAHYISDDESSSSNPSGIPLQPQMKPSSDRTVPEAVHRIRKMDNALHSTNERPNLRSSKDFLVHANDYIYRTGPWDGPPIVLPEYKLIFFTIPKVGCTVWKQFFRRVAGFENWKKDGGSLELPHNPSSNGLLYLNQFSLEEASTMMSSPDYTRALFVRNPHERFLSAYLDKAVRRDGAYLQNHCCRNFGSQEKTQACTKEAGSSLEAFVNMTSKHCRDPHWLPQSERMERKYLPYLNFVGKVETAQADAQRLLKRISRQRGDETDLWEKFAACGWGKDGTEAMFQSKSTLKHGTSAKSKLSQYYTSQEVWDQVKTMYQRDYDLFFPANATTGMEEDLFSAINAEG